MTTNPIHTCPATAIAELQQLIDQCRYAHVLLDSAEVDNADVRRVIADALTAINVAEVLGYLRPTCAHAWRLAACDPGARTPVEESNARIAKLAPRGIADLSIHSLRQAQRACLDDQTPGGVLATERFTRELIARAPGPHLHA